ncbi:MAG TPA: VCBS repeat-containing protein [Candidatus Hydrogenedentes bacterium]|nr:VCBS repeat-containing protein [Candidatus Hydrogenedentota bacterium]
MCLEFVLKCLSIVLIYSCFVSPMLFADALPVSSAEVASGWTAEMVAQVDQSYAGWDVEIGDADNDGQNEILTTGCPDSRLYLFKKRNGTWESHILAENLAEQKPGMGLAVKVVDLNHDGKNEIALGTGQEKGGTAFLYVFQMDGQKITKQLSCRPECNQSSYTHNLALYDLDNDGIMEIISAYCGGGEIIRYDVDAALTTIEARKIYHLSGSGEESLIEDVDNDGHVEFLTSNGFRAGRARVELFEFDDKGELQTPPRLVLDGYEGNPCFYASLLVGDVDNCGKNELIIGWKKEQKVNKATLLGYRVDQDAKIVYSFERDTEDLDMAYFEKMMVIADANNDKKNELVISTRGDNVSEFITSTHLGHVFQYSVDTSGALQKTMLVNFAEDFAESSWLAAGDADNDGRNDVVLATGKGDRTRPGTSVIILLNSQRSK